MSGSEMDCEADLDPRLDPGVKCVGSNQPWQIKLLYDGECPLCLREVNFLKHKDGGRGLVAFVDIADPGYDPALHGGIDYATAMQRIHAVTPDGSVLQNIAVFRRIYQVLGMGWVYAFSDWPILGAWADAVYGVWARWRLKLTARPDLADLMAARGRADGRTDCGCSSAERASSGISDREA